MEQRERHELEDLRELSKSDKAEIQKLRAELAARDALLKEARELCDEIEAILGGEYADHYGPLYEIVQSVRDRIDTLTKGGGE